MVYSETPARKHFHTKLLDMARSDKYVAKFMEARNLARPFCYTSDYLQQHIVAYL